MDMWFFSPHPTPPKKIKHDDLGGIFQKYIGTHGARIRPRAWKFSWSKVWLILNISCFESMLICFKATKVFITIDSRKNMKNDDFFRNIKNMMLNIARGFYRARLELFLIESLIHLEHFLFRNYAYISLKQRKYS